MLAHPPAGGAAIIALSRASLNINCKKWQKAPIQRAPRREPIGADGLVVLVCPVLRKTADGEYRPLQVRRTWRHRASVSRRIDFPPREKSTHFPQKVAGKNSPGVVVGENFHFPRSRARRRFVSTPGDGLILNYSQSRLFTRAAQFGAFFLAAWRIRPSARLSGGASSGSGSSRIPGEGLLLVADRALCNGRLIGSDCRFPFFRHMLWEWDFWDATFGG